MIKLLAFIAVVAFVSAVSAPSASAAPAQSVRSETWVSVSITDLDLSTDRGVAVLMRRVGRAADKACGGRPPATAFLEERRAFRRCRADAIGPVVAALDQRYWTVQWAGLAPRPMG